jgi:hypothetical protein
MDKSGNTGAGGAPAAEDDYTAMMRDLQDIILSEGKGYSEADGQRVVDDIRSKLQAMGVDVDAALGTGVGGGAAGHELVEAASLDDSYDEEEDIYSDGSDELGYPARVPQSNRPRPVDLWKAAHEVPRVTASRPKLTEKEWDDLVDRLNEKARDKQKEIMRAQHRRIAEELAGLTFTPKICKKSREYASSSQPLPDRVDTLMRLKKQKIERVRYEQTQEELKSATFKPEINSNSRATLRARSKIKNLNEYLAEKKYRAKRRLQIIREIEEREHTGAPQINANSLRIAEKAEMERKRRMQLHKEGLLAAEDVDPRRKPKITQRRNTEGRLVLTVDGREVTKEDQTRLPGHEEDTFKPQINPRSRTVRREGGDVFSRLYSDAQRQIATKKAVVNQYTRETINVDVDGEEGLDLGAGFRLDMEVAARSGGDGGAPAAAPSSNSPDYFNVVAYQPKWDFIVRKLTT